MVKFAGFCTAVGGAAVGLCEFWVHFHAKFGHDRWRVKGCAAQEFKILDMWLSCRFCSDWAMRTISGLDLYH